MIGKNVDAKTLKRFLDHVSPDASVSVRVGKLTLPIEGAATHFENVIIRLNATELIDAIATAMTETKPL